MQNGGKCVFYFYGISINSPTLSCLNKFDQKDMTCLMHQRLSYNAIKFKSLTNFSFLFLLLLLPQKYCLRDES